MRGWSGSDCVASTRRSSRWCFSTAPRCNAITALKAKGSTPLWTRAAVADGAPGASGTPRPNSSGGIARARYPLGGNARIGA